MSLLRDVFSLNEDWCLIEDAADTGKGARWFRLDNAPKGVALQLPYHPKNAYATTHDRHAPTTPYWLIRSFECASEQFQHRHCELAFEGFPSATSIWLNGQHLSTQNACFLPFSLPIHAQLQPG